MSSHAGAIDHHQDPSTTTGIPNKKLLMWAFLASDCMFFGALIATHLIYRLHPPVGNPDPKDIFSPALTSFSTFILLMSSLLMALAVNAIQKNNVKATRKWLLGTMFFGSIFLWCQVYEFQEFVHIKGMTITNSMLGTTFFTLTGTHGTHVAIGVFWLTLMYIRSFQPVNGARGAALLFRYVCHLALFVALFLLSLKSVLNFVHLIHETGFSGGMIVEYLKHDFLVLAGMIAAVGGLSVLGRARGPVDFDEHNAIDVESMGLYWHFVDIVWIVIFTAVYLIEFI
jgi:cytochrome o ubiquinol oxidase subunit 3